MQKKVTETISNSNTFMSKVEAEYETPSLAWPSQDFNFLPFSRYEKTAGIEGVASASVKVCLPGDIFQRYTANYQ